MSSKYAPDHSLPEGFDEELRSLARECLRAWATAKDAAPGDSRVWTMQFCHDYFAAGGRAALASARGDAARAAAAGEFPSPEELRARISAIFHGADLDGNHFLDRNEFKRCMKMFADELGLDVGDLRHIMANADDSDDGVISYEEFVPVALELLTAIFARRKFLAEAAARQEHAATESRAYLLHGMPQEELEASLRSLFDAADIDRDGVLTRAEFAEALKGSDLGFTKKQVALLADEADVAGDGVIQFEAALPAMFALLSDLVAKQIEYAALPSGEARVAEYLVSVVGEYDPDGAGRVALGSLKQALRESDFGLTVLQTRSLLGLAEPDAGGLVDYRAWAVRAAGLLEAVMRVAVDSEKASRLVLERSRGEFATVNGFSRDEFDERLAVLLGAVGDGAGRASADALHDALVDGAGSGIAFSPAHATTLVNLGYDGDYSAEDGTIGLQFVLHYAFATLQAAVEMEALTAY